MIPSIKHRSEGVAVRQSLLSVALACLLLGASGVHGLPSPILEKSASPARRNLQLEAESLEARADRPFRRALGKSWTGKSTLNAGSNLGIGATMMNYFYDKAENNPGQVKGHSAWGEVYTISSGASRYLNLQTNSAVIELTAAPIKSHRFCAGGGWLSNGTLVSIGGNGVQSSNTFSQNGVNAIRLFTPCQVGGSCDVQEWPNKLRLTSKRWYPSTSRLQDGSIIIIGGTRSGGFNNKASKYFPPKGNGLSIPFKFLSDALNSNLFPVTFLLPQTGYLFIAANKLATIYDWKNNREYRLPSMPNGVAITYPASAAGALLPLSIANKYASEVLLCGGTTANIDGNPTALSSNTATSKQCARILISGTGSSRGWQVEQMPEARIMGSAILTPDAKGKYDNRAKSVLVLLVNGAQTGVAGYGNVANRIGASNAGNPAYRPTLYDPVAPAGSRFSTNFPSSKSERLYHSTASLVADGRIIIAGSNPNDRVSTKSYMTRFNTEYLSPPYMSLPRPVLRSVPSSVNYGASYTIRFSRISKTSTIRMVVNDIGYSTHGVHMNQRWLELPVTSIQNDRLTFTGPIDTTYYPPGYGWLWVLEDDVPSQGKRVMVGTGASPPSTKSASANLLSMTSGVDDTV
ncbi:BZ3500_MvSof-1268-A1-R1_Chr7-1g09222 [Microbotryum saponariae]|uniref:BZ3500_MvSof-1268-A1-R1_Chr7-1g09222 protein n=1 Tax=Microbotryum saponariae TaxID=289078 RepID=A0A2X0NCR2_9BASI|nr:BZ3501_MvSof-1269-A2-R1_Chr7-1g08927 [Microbotryum saponariae]SDA03026.1 BZ3500_MvSof-1268-A1-R1_Chr7-1g09222 [Microbotryum saponariae]